MGEKAFILDNRKKIININNQKAIRYTKYFVSLQKFEYCISIMIIISVRLLNRWVIL